MRTTATMTTTTTTTTTSTTSTHTTYTQNPPLPPTMSFWRQAGRKSPEHLSFLSSSPLQKNIKNTNGNGLNIYP